MLNSIHPQVAADPRLELPPKREYYPFDPQISLLFLLVLNAPHLPKLLGLGFLS